MLTDEQITEIDRSLLAKIDGMKPEVEWDQLELMAMLIDVIEDLKRLRASMRRAVKAHPWDAQAEILKALGDEA